MRFRRIAWLSVIVLGAAMVSGAQVAENALGFAGPFGKVDPAGAMCSEPDSRWIMVIEDFESGFS